MKAIDTNLLVRFLVGDDQRQASLVKTRFLQAESSGELLLVPLLVVLETIWVLESAYHIQRGEILDALADLLLLAILEFEHRQVVQAMIVDGRQTRLDLPDLLIAHVAKASLCTTVLTFDRKAARSPLFELLK